MQQLNIDGHGSGPSFSLPVENELLMLKLEAEFGARCVVGNAEVPAEVINDFLQSVYFFEKQLRAASATIRIATRLGDPVFPDRSLLTTTQLKTELNKLFSLLSEINVRLEILGDYPEEVIYDFVTKEFLFIEIRAPAIEGFVHQFCYEDFYPNHEIDIGQRSDEFITQWLGKMINEHSWELGESFVHPDGRTFSKAEVLKKFQSIFAAFEGFNLCGYQIDKVMYEWDEQTQTGKGFSQGFVSYTATLDNKEQINYRGPFEFYLDNRDNWWSIYYFAFPGFSWNDRWPD